MGFSSNSNELELPRVGEVWLELGKRSYRVGETPARQRLWLVLYETPSLHNGPPRFTLMNLESGGTCYVNAGKFWSNKRPWERFASPAE